jgi:hypothetical protein
MASVVKRRTKDNEVRYDVRWRADEDRLATPTKHADQRPRLTTPTND